MRVVDASVMVDFVLGAGSPAGDSVAEYLRGGEVLCAPHLIDAEVGQTLRRFNLRKDLTDDEATSCLSDFLVVPITRYPDRALLPRAFELRQNVTVYDALYLTLAESLDCPLVTGDDALDDVPHTDAVVEVVLTSA